MATLVPAAATPREAALRFAAGMLAGDDVSLVAKREAMQGWVHLGIPVQPRWSGEVAFPPEHNEEYEGEVICPVWGDQSPFCVVALVPGPGDDVPYMLLGMAVSLADAYDGPFEPVPGTEHPPMVVDVTTYTPGNPP